MRTTVELLRLHRKVDKIFNKIGQVQGSVVEAALVNEAAVEKAIEMEPPPRDGPSQEVV